MSTAFYDLVGPYLLVGAGHAEFADAALPRSRVPALARGLGEVDAGEGRPHAG